MSKLPIGTPEQLEALREFQANKKASWNRYCRAKQRALELKAIDNLGEPKVRPDDGQGKLL